MKTEFVIITTTYERPIEIIRCLESVQNQTYKNFKHIIVNDSPATNYSKLEEKVSTLSNVIYIKNEDNLGKNASVNKVFQILKSENFSDYIIFLDDDDWLYNDALENIGNILEKEKVDWLVTNRTNKNKTLTKVKKIKNKYNYFWDMLLLRNLYGDATHAIKTKKATNFNFCQHIKNGEELYYFIQLPFEFTYKNINTTDSDGYSVNGLTDLLKNKYKENTKKLWREKFNLKMFIYMILRTMKTFTR